ncbi:putative E3 ubiquitin-protein ligase [Forsythia ovata]|uniref:E3 ubiquitin-protein ligase n=1 Tax=Forsythia ovata TaxID=205694 RepID=A0ABD1VNH3_9LAMI
MRLFRLAQEDAIEEEDGTDAHRVFHTENSFSTTSSSIRSSSLRLAEEILSKSENPFSSFLLSLAYSHCRRPIDASFCLLDVFYADPSLARVEIAPFLFEELFLVHFLPMLEWYNEQRSRILSSLPLNSDYNSDDQSIVSTTTTLSKMSGDQALALKDLERDYEDLLDENCRNFVVYFKEVLRNRDGGQLIVPPSSYSVEYSMGICVVFFFNRILLG